MLNFPIDGNLATDISFSATVIDTYWNRIYAFGGNNAGSIGNHQYILLPPTTSPTLTLTPPPICGNRNDGPDEIVFDYQ